jgi:hypothetical protein
MKKLTLAMWVAIFIAVGVSGCQKECTSTCGIITDDAILDNGCYSLTIKNNCSGNTKTFCFDINTWFTAYVGDNFCVTNTVPW